MHKSKAKGYGVLSQLFAGDRTTKFQLQDFEWCYIDTNKLRKVS